MTTIENLRIRAQSDAVDATHANDDKGHRAPDAVGDRQRRPLYRRIVVGTDGSSMADRAVEVASYLARQWEVPLHIVAAYDSGSSGLGSLAGAPLAETGLCLGIRQLAAEGAVQTAVQSWCLGVDVQRHTVLGPLADAMFAVTKMVGAELIVVGNSPVRGVRRIRGNRPKSIARRARCAVLIVTTD